MTLNQRIGMTFDLLIARRDPFDWNTVVREVKADRIPIRNWMKVRGILQGFINEGVLTRAPSVEVEEYIVK